ncbi:MAG: twin-arginine translocase TatA/TatE family subunit [Desulfitobacterium hafniense]|nr:twin-arginine translocase TatA/TatE family subunit [Desulfitobacterium hafniense]
MPSLGFPELVVILVMALIIFVPGKLPDVGRSIGKAIREFKTAKDSTINEITAAPSQTNTEDKTTV